VRAQKTAIGRNPDDRLSHRFLLIILNGRRYDGQFDGPIVSQMRVPAPADPQAKYGSFQPVLAFLAIMSSCIILARGKGLWLSCRAAGTGRRYKILNVR
jgi:hypothetical protein